MIKTRLRDFVITKEGWIFAVADYCRGDGIRAILRYVPDPGGTRGKDTRYRKFDFDDAFEFMKKERPEWVKDVHIIPLDEVMEVLSPSEHIKKLKYENEKIAQIVDTLEKGGIPVSSMGVTGSRLAGLENESSDIDFIVYGKMWFKARDIISAAKRKNENKGSGIMEISDEMWQDIYKKRKPEISFGEFLRHEMRKGNRGMVGDTYFDLLYVRDWDEIDYRCRRGKDTGTARIMAEVINAEYAFDSPAIYEINHPEISQVLSYTHTYAGQVREGEIMEACGIIEELPDITRLVVGTKREPKGEWIRSLTLMQAK